MYVCMCVRVYVSVCVHMCVCVLAVGLDVTSHFGTTKRTSVFILTSPNRNFPLDFQHNYPSLKLYKKWGNRTLMNKWRSIKGKYLSLHLHSPFNKINNSSAYQT